MTEVALVNKSRRTHVIVLDHEAFRSKRYGFSIGGHVVHDESRSGERSRRVVRRAMPGSITLLPGGRVDGLHPAIEKVSQVAKLLARSEVEIVPMELAPTVPSPNPPQDESARARLGAKKAGSRDE